MLLTSKTFFHDFKVFPAGGVTPDVPLSQDVDALDYTLSSLGSL